ncbi:MAG TPA: hypothetical protein VNV82_19040 [Bryobacteraceae bacterium]|jgi:hypothetical protein|nr:hypothetical protein [Bryobacteraceae bacterium]
MQRYRITTPLVAVRLFSSRDSEKPGMLVSLPEDAMVEVGGRSQVGKGMLEVRWQSERYAVFEMDLEQRGTLEFQD